MSRRTTLEEDRQAHYRALARAERRAGVLWVLAFAACMASWIVADQLVRPWLATLY
jgi:hypothetical protein